MPDYTFELDSLTDLYKSGDWRLQEVISSMREHSRGGSTIIVQRTFENAPTTELFRFQNINQLNDWILKTFPKRILYHFANVKQNMLDFVLIKSSEPIQEYMVSFKKIHNNNRVLILEKDGYTLVGSDHDINHFKDKDNFDDLEWNDSLITDPSKSYA